MRRPILSVLAAVLLAAAGPAVAADTAATTVQIPGSHQIDFTARATGRPYRLLVHVPAGTPPQGGWPVLVLLDGNLYFATAVDALRLQGLHFVRQAVVVGVGYQTDDPVQLMTLRVKDLTLPIPAEMLLRPSYNLLLSQRGQTVDSFGDLDTYLAMIETEALPRVAALAPLNPADRHLYGHSLGGLATLRAVFHGPTRWRTATASSPSIWWADRAVLADMPMLNSAGPRTALQIFVGGREDELPPGLPANPKAEAAIASVRMTANVRELRDTLAADPRLAVRAEILPNDDHVSITPTTISRAIRFAFGRHSTDWLRAPDQQSAPATPQPAQ